MIYKLDRARTAALYRIIATNNRAGMRELLRDLGKLLGVIGPCAAVNRCLENNELYAAAEIVDQTFTFETFCIEAEALDRNDAWASFGVWVPAA